MRLLATALVILVTAFLGVLWYLTRPVPTDADRFAACRSSTIAGGPGSIGGPFTLINDRGETVTDRDVITEPTILYFGYTFCPDVCPMDSARNADAVDLLAKRGISTTPVFISVDPKRDTPEAVGDFAYNLHEKMIGLTGTPEQVKSASTAYKTYYKANTDEGGDYYLVDHSTFSYLVLPDHGFVEFFRRENTAEEIADSVACFVNQL
jgi:protein SCO1/2